MPQLPIDLKRSNRWAIANVESVGMILAGRTVFDLVNLKTVRAHRMVLGAAGFALSLPVSGSFSSSNYSSFTTRHAVNFDDFDGKGARLTSIAVVVYSFSRLTVYEGAAYFTPVLCSVKTAGWGPTLPSAGFEHGVTEIVYGDGNALDSSGFASEPNLDDLPTSPEQLTVGFQITQQDQSAVIKFKGDSLFDFDKYAIKPEADRALRQAGAIMRAIRVKRLDIDGHTDGKGDDRHNQQLSEQRAQAVANWFVSNKYINRESIETKGWGKSKPVAANTHADGSDDPEGRAQNRRVELFLIR